MSHTNSTPNYNLPQFVGSDKPTWLNDVNGAMSAIDTQMKANADSATSASTSATTANNAIGTLASLTTTAKTDLVSAINEVDSNADTASGVASNAVTTANQANTKVTALEAYLDLVTFTTPTATATGFNITRNEMACASNLAGTMGKIYGEIRGTASVNGNATITIATPLRPTSAISINGGIMNFWSGDGSNFVPGGMIALNIATDGTATVTWSATSGREYRFYFMNSVIFAQNFGDTPIPE